MHKTCILCTNTDNADQYNSILYTALQRLEHNLIIG